jgi:hypothetical protein
MGGLGQKKQLALDNTNILLDLAERKDYAHQFRECFQENGYTLFAGSTMFQELAFSALNDPEPKRSNARRAIAQAPVWNILPFILSSVQRAIAQRFASRLLGEGILPEDERNDALILSEAATAEIPLLTTCDKHLLDIDEDLLLIMLHGADLTAIRPSTEIATCLSLRARIPQTKATETIAVFAPSSS